MVAVPSVSAMSRSFMPMFRARIGLSFERSILAILSVAIVSLYAAVFAGVDFAAAARAGVDDDAGPGPRGEQVALANLPVLTGPAALDLAALVKGTAGPVIVADTSSLRDKFDLIDYSLAAVRERRGDVPRIYLTSLPPDLADVAPVAERKALFIKLLLPLVLRANEAILEDRAHIAALYQRLRSGKRLGAGDAAWSDALAESYGLEPGDFEGLLQRLDAVPPSLAIAQSIEESGWGTSRFAQDGNAVFGQRTFTVGAGLVPLDRDDGKRHEVRVFDHLQQSVATYLANLNRHPVYADFRAARAAIRAAGKPFDGYALAGTLSRYSERGAAYIDAIRLIMRLNELHTLDDAQLRGAPEDAG